MISRIMLHEKFNIFTLKCKKTNLTFKICLSQKVNKLIGYTVYRDVKVVIDGSNIPFFSS